MSSPSNSPSPSPPSTSSSYSSSSLSISRLYCENCMAKSYISLITIFLISPFTISCWLINPDRCNPGCIQIYQWPSGFAGGLHIPKYTVQIVNEAWNVKGISGVKISCPAFASTVVINPRIFRRLDMANCLLNDGGIINPGQVITFEYSNILPYPFLVTSLKCV